MQKGLLEKIKDKPENVNFIIGILQDLKPTKIISQESLNLLCNKLEITDKTSKEKLSIKSNKEIIELLKQSKINQNLKVQLIGQTTRNYLYAISKNGEFIQYVNGEISKFKINPIIHSECSNESHFFLDYYGYIWIYPLSKTFLKSKFIKFLCAGEDNHFFVIDQHSSLFHITLCNSSRNRVNINQISLNKKVKEVFCGFSFQFIICDDKRNSVWCKGKNSYGQLCVGDFIDRKEFVPLQLRNNKNKRIKIQKISCGISHCILVSKLNHVYTCGSNIFGQLGKPHPTKLLKPDTISQPYKLDILSKKRISRVSCHRNKSFCIDFNGNIFVFGENCENPCFPTKIDIFPPISFISHDLRANKTVFQDINREIWFMNYEDNKIEKNECKDIFCEENETNNETIITIVDNKKKNYVSIKYK